jgi:hypothetical protein
VRGDVRLTDKGGEVAVRYWWDEGGVSEEKEGGRRGSGRTRRRRDPLGIGSPCDLSCCRVLLTVECREERAEDGREEIERKGEKKGQQ